MRTALGLATTLVALGMVTTAAPQEPLRAPTLQERVVHLEAAVATLETRTGVQSARPADLGIGETALGLAGRVDALERALERLAADVQRIERAVDNAARDAADARREAGAAQQAARDAAMRSR
jgi:hypothetical protein